MEHQFSDPQVEAELLQLLVHGQAVDCKEFVIPLREVFEQPGVLQALRGASLLHRSASYVVVYQHGEQLVLAVRLRDQHFLQHVVRQAHDFEGFDVPQGQGRYFAVVYPLLSGFGGLLS